MLAGASAAEQRASLSATEGEGVLLAKGGGDIARLSPACITDCQENIRVGMRKRR